MQDLMAGIRRTLAGANKRYLVFGLLFILIFAGLSFARCTQVHAPVPPGDAAAQEQPAQEAQDDSDEAPGTGEEIPQESAEPDDAMRSLIDAYDADTRAFVDLLRANVWTSGSDTRSLSFTETGFTETSRDKTHEAAFAVSALETDVATEQGVNGESSTVTTHTAAILTSEGTSLLTLREFTDGVTGETTSSVASPAFTISESYVLTHSSGGVSVTGMDQAFDTLLDGKSGELQKAVADYCAVRYPTVSTAAWDMTASVDYAGRTVSTGFVLDNPAKTKLYAIYHMGGGAIEVG